MNSLNEGGCNVMQGVAHSAACHDGMSKQVEIQV